MKIEFPKVSRDSVVIATTIAWLIGCPALVQAASPEAIASGREAFNSVCALCHGEDARGTGPLAKLLINGAPDLTLLSKRSRGAFPFSTVVDVIEGLAPAAGHGIREMPVWGRTFRQEGERGKILDILLYLESIQSK